MHISKTKTTLMACKKIMRLTTLDENTENNVCIQWAPNKYSLAVLMVFLVIAAAG